MMEEHQLGGKLLAGVSRSFYLTLKALPGGLREPLSLAYLLARAADTIADTPGVPVSLKLELLGEFDRMVQNQTRDPAGESRLISRLRADFVPKQTDENERLLLQRLHEAFDALSQTPARQAANIRGVLTPIVRGQTRDIERFPADGILRALATAAELDEYTWLVAGCVGEFWTKLCVEELPDGLVVGTSISDMVERGSRFGKGLQLVNILRDTGKDAAMGRCYLPLEEIAAAGLRLDEIGADLSKLTPLFGKWETQCVEHLSCGIDYVEALKNKRLKFATALPLLLGFRTLSRVRRAPWEERVRGVKVGRAEVGKVMFDAGIAVLRKDGIRKLAETLLR